MSQILLLISSLFFVMFRYVICSVTWRIITKAKKEIRFVRLIRSGWFVNSFVFCSILWALRLFSHSSRPSQPPLLPARWAHVHGCRPYTTFEEHWEDLVQQRCTLIENDVVSRCCLSPVGLNNTSTSS